MFVKMSKTIFIYLCYYYLYFRNPIKITVVSIAIVSKYCYYVENYKENADSVVITWCRLLLVQCAMLKRQKRFLWGTFGIGKRMIGRRPSYVAAVQNSSFFQHVGFLRVWLLIRFRLFHFCGPFRV